MSAFRKFKACVPIEWSPNLYITLVRGIPGTRRLHRRTLEALRLGKCNRTVMRWNTPTVRGMIQQIWTRMCSVTPCFVLFLKTKTSLCDFYTKKCKRLFFFFCLFFFLHQRWISLPPVRRHLPRTHLLFLLRHQLPIFSSLCLPLSPSLLHLVSVSDRGWLMPIINISIFFAWVEKKFAW